MFALAILRVRKPDGRSGVFSVRSVVAHTRPEPGRPGLATAGRKHRHRRVVGLVNGGSSLQDRYHEPAFRA
jgi:hypothetical protein